MCLGGKQPDPPVTTPNYKPEDIDKNMKFERTTVEDHKDEPEATATKEVRM